MNLIAIITPNSKDAEAILRRAERTLCTCDIVPRRVDSKKYKKDFAIIVEVPDTVRETVIAHIRCAQRFVNVFTDIYYC